MEKRHPDRVSCSSCLSSAIFLNSANHYLDVQLISTSDLISGGIALSISAVSAWLAMVWVCCYGASATSIVVGSVSILDYQNYMNSGQFDLI